MSPEPPGAGPLGSWLPSPTPCEDAPHRTPADQAVSFFGGAGLPGTSGWIPARCPGSHCPPVAVLGAQGPGAAMEGELADEAAE